MTKVTFITTAAQGDLLLRKIDAMPVQVKELAPIDGVFVIAHSETGHNHVIDSAPNVKWYSGDDAMISYLEVVDASDATETLLRHLRGHDTHKTIVVPVGVFELRRQREYTPQGWRRVED